MSAESAAVNLRRGLEGLDPAGPSFVLELDMLYGGQFHVKRTLSPLLHNTASPKFSARTVTRRAVPRSFGRTSIWTWTDGATGSKENYQAGATGYITSAV